MWRLLREGDVARTPSGSRSHASPAHRDAAWRRWWCAPLAAVDLRFRRDSVEAAVWATLLVCPAVAAYGLLARPAGDALALCILCALTIAGSLLTLRLPWDHFVRSPWREAYYGTWWITEFSVIVAATVLGGGPGSPLLLLLFIQLVFTGLSYPQASVALAIAITLLTVVALAIIYAEPVSSALVQFTAFAGTGLMAYLQTRNHVRRSQALSESESRLAEAQQIAHIGSWEWTSSGFTTSDELRQIFGVNNPLDTPEEYMGRVHPRDRDEVERSMARAAAEGGSFNVEHRIVRDDGRIRTVTVQGHAHRGRDAVRVTGVTRDITELRQVEARLRHQADHDPLTGLLSRRRLIAEIDRHLTLGSASGRRGALLLLDIDGFGFYNDSYGQAAGDALLRSIGSALVHRLRATDIVARSGGDEFAIVLPDATTSDAEHIAQELRSLLTECAGESTVTASIGIAAFGPGSEAAAGNDVLVAADIALHEAELSGGNRVILYHGQTGPDLTSVHRIRAAFKEDRFVLHGQPIIDLTTDRVSHHELLIRIRDEDGSLVEPGAFLPTAERFGLINAIDRWVARTAVTLAGDGRRVALNLSANSIGDTEIIHIVRSAADAGIDPALLIVEITETAAIANLQEAREFSQALAAIGCQVAIDDFGTGFGSLAYLKHIPARFVKIDREFVKDLTHSPTDQHVVRAVVGIARSLSQLTIAEGVEDGETLALVRSLGVDYVQGFHTGRPAPMWPAVEPVAAAEIAA